MAHGEKTGHGQGTERRYQNIIEMHEDPDVSYSPKWMGNFGEQYLDERKNNHAEHICIPTLNPIDLIGRFRARSSEE
jgi:hypothetical protein